MDTADISVHLTKFAVSGDVAGSVLVYRGQDSFGDSKFDTVLELRDTGTGSLINTVTLASGVDHTVQENSNIIVTEDGNAVLTRTNTAGTSRPIPPPQPRGCRSRGQVRDTYDTPARSPRSMTACSS